MFQVLIQVSFGQDYVVLSIQAADRPVAASECRWLTRLSPENSARS